MRKINPYAPWTEEEHNKLIKYFPIATREHLISLFPNRTYEAIKVKAKNLKLRKQFCEPFDAALFGGDKKIHSGVVSTKGNVTIHRMR